MQYIVKTKYTTCICTYVHRKLRHNLRSPCPSCSFFKYVLHFSLISFIKRRFFVSRVNPIGPQLCIEKLYASHFFVLYIHIIIKGNLK